MASVHSIAPPLAFILVWFAIGFREVEKTAKLGLTNCIQF